MADYEAAHQIGIALGKLYDQVSRLKYEIEKWDRMPKSALRDRSIDDLNGRIARLEERIKTAEKVQESYLKG